jgi:hypothetical protein
LNNLSTKSLLEAYQKAIEYNLKDAFITLLLKELSKRGIDESLITDYRNKANAKIINFDA